MEKTTFSFTKKDALSFRCNEFKEKVLLTGERVPGIGKALSKKRLSPARYGSQPILTTDEGREAIVRAVKKGEPFMAGRFGTTEGGALAQYCRILLKYGEEPSRLPQTHLDVMCRNAGFFPNDKEALWKWCELEADACRDVDLLGVMYFHNERWVTTHLCSQAQLTPNGALGSARVNWTHSLEGKKVLVVHPFTDTIMKQYTQKRELIFPDCDTLPVFDLKCVKAVQTIADAEDSRFKTWFEALDYMKDEISKQDFDVCLIGCGAYGFQLASHVKRIGKIAVHMGGSLQTLFGIRGSRWDKKYSYWYNDAWVTPSEEEKPKGFEKIEGGCYW